MVGAVVFDTVVVAFVVISSFSAAVFLTVSPASVAVVGANASTSPGANSSVSIAVVLNTTVSVAVARSGFATVAVAVSVECEVMRDHAPSPLELTARTCTSYSVLGVSPLMVYSRAPPPVCQALSSLGPVSGAGFPVADVVGGDGTATGVDGFFPGDSEGLFVRGRSGNGRTTGRGGHAR